jgi:hypothetical protein
MHASTHVDDGQVTGYECKWAAKRPEMRVLTIT